MRQYSQRMNRLHTPRKVLLIDIKRYIILVIFSKTLNAAIVPTDKK